jgi:hypothetical protein
MADGDFYFIDPDEFECELIAQKTVFANGRRSSGDILALVLDSEHILEKGSD